MEDCSCGWGKLPGKHDCPRARTVPASTPTAAREQATSQVSSGLPRMSATLVRPCEISFRMPAGPGPLRRS